MNVLSLPIQAIKLESNYKNFDALNQMLLNGMERTLLAT